MDRSIHHSHEAYWYYHLEISGINSLSLIDPASQ